MSGVPPLVIALGTGGSGGSGSPTHLHLRPQVFDFSLFSPPMSRVRFPSPPPVSQRRGSALRGCVFGSRHPLGTTQSRRCTRTRRQEAQGSSFGCVAIRSYRAVSQPVHWTSRSGNPCTATEGPAPGPHCSTTSCRDCYARSPRTRAPRPTQRTPDAAARRPPLGRSLKSCRCGTPVGV